MNLISKIASFIKNIFNKTGNLKTIEMPKQKVDKEKNDNFKESIKIIENKKTIETLICEGDGLGIQNKISY